MKRTKIIPFDWDYYQANKDKCRVITSHEEPIEVTQLTKFEAEDEYPLVGVVDNEKESWTEIGEYFSSKTNSFNLQLEVTEEVVESWVNVYVTANGKRYCGASRNSKEDALESASCAKSILICTIPLHELKEDEA